MIPNPVSHDPSVRELPPPHLARERVHVTSIGTWEVRGFAVNDPRHPFLARRGMLHLQLWHPEAAVSILTRSGLTRGQWEVAHGADRYRCACYPCLRRFVAQEAEVVAPCLRQIERLLRQLVYPALLGASCLPTNRESPRPMR